MGCKDMLFRFVVLGSLVVAVAFNIWVLASCEYMKSGGGADIGVWRYQLNDRSSKYNTQGVCTSYSGLVKDPWAKASQAFGVMAPLFGILLILLILVTQCCCPVPCFGCLISLGYIGAQLSTAFVWFVAGNQVCEWTGCKWGQAATGNFIAQMLYLLAAICHKCLPSPREARADHKAAAAEKKAAEAEAKQKEAEQKQAEAEAKAAQAEKIAEAGGAVPDTKAQAY